MPLSNTNKKTVSAIEKRRAAQRKRKKKQRYQDKKNRHISRVEVRVHDDDACFVRSVANILKAKRGIGDVNILGFDECDIKTISGGVNPNRATKPDEKIATLKEVLVRQYPVEKIEAKVYPLKNTYFLEFKLYCIQSFFTLEFTSVRHMLIMLMKLNFNTENIGNSEVEKMLNYLKGNINVSGHNN